jgi:hypothetical protein
MRQVLESLKTGKPFDKDAWELKWVAGSGVSAMMPFDNPLKAAHELVAKALSEELPIEK